MNEMNDITLPGGLNPDGRNLSIRLNNPEIRLTNVDLIQEAPFLLEGVNYMLRATGNLPTVRKDNVDETQAVEIYQLTDMGDRFVMVLIGSEMHTRLRRAFNDSMRNNFA